MIGFKDAKSSHYVPPSVREGDQGDDHVADYMFKDVPVAEKTMMRFNARLTQWMPTA